MAPLHTPLELVQLSARFLGERGVPNPRLDAELLLAHVLGVPRIQLYLQFDRPLEPAEVDGYREAVRRRSRREPAAYVTGTREFWSLEFRVDRRVLVPRPETETLVQAGLDRMGQRGRLLELGVGSGAVISALLTERPGWSGVGVDCAEGALDVARDNARRLGLDGRLEVRGGDLFAAVAGEKFGCIVANPPYIPSAEIDGLEPEVARYEPREALDGGPDGLAAIRRIAVDAPGHLEPTGVLAVEFGAGQEEAVLAIFERTGGYGRLELVADHGGRPRVLTAAP